jgi:hypothetical protein
MFQWNPFFGDRFGTVGSGVKLLSIESIEPLRDQALELQEFFH